MSSFHSLVDLATKEPSVEAVLGMPFAYYHIWVYPFVHGDAPWQDGLSAQERDVAYSEIHALANHLLEAYRGTGKTFFLGHWEGDWYLHPGFNPNQDPSPTAIQGMIEWLNLRQRAVDDAKRKTPPEDVHVYHYTEVNLVRKALQGGKCLVNDVLPYTQVDYVSYSSYDTVIPHRGKVREALHSALDMIESRLPPKPGISGKRVFIGEFGFPLDVAATPEKQEEYSREVCRAAVEWGCPFVLYWQLYCNEKPQGKHRGFWLIDDQNRKQPFYHTLRDYYERMKRGVAEFKRKQGGPPSENRLRMRALEILGPEEPTPGWAQGRFAESAPGAWRVRLLPGQTNRVFTLYGCPSDLNATRRLITRMSELELGNGFDPGPTTVAANAPQYRYFAEIGWPVIGYPPYGGEFQVKHGRAQLIHADEVALQVMDRSNTFLAVQLGEWGYYLHNLSINEQWHRDVFGDEFDAFKHCIKPAELRGYDPEPLNRRACYDQVRDYFLTRHRAMRGRTISITGHSHYEAYAGEWGSRVIGLELGENIAFTQSKIAFARGASRQWNRPFSIQVSPWFHGSCTTSGPLRMETKQYARGLDAGHSLSFYRRLWLHSWFSGAALVTPENSISIFFETGDPDWTLTQHGEAAAEVFKTMQNHDPGVPFTPVAIVLDHYAGYNAYQGRPWGILQNTSGDLETRDLFQQQLFPGSDHIHTRPNPLNPESSYLRPTPYGEMFDVLLSNVGPDVLASYPVILLVGDHEFDAQFVTRLFDALRAGSQLLLHHRHTEQLGVDLQRLRGTGSVEVLESWVNPTTGRPTAISGSRLAQLRDSLLPVRIIGDPVQYQINRTEPGWLVELINPRGVIKTPTAPARIDTNAIAQITMTTGIPVTRASLLRSGETLSSSASITLSIPPGETRFVALEVATSTRASMGNAREP